jgi:hypothetical protein
VSREERRRRLAPFRAARFRLVAGVVVEQEGVLHKRLLRRDQQLCPAPEDMLDMQGKPTADAATCCAPKGVHCFTSGCCDATSSCAPEDMLDMQGKPTAEQQLRRKATYAGFAGRGDDHTQSCCYMCFACVQCISPFPAILHVSVYS